MTRIRIPTAICAALAVALAAAPAAAHPPTQHDSQRISFDRASGFAPALTGLGAIECEDGSAGPYPCRNVDLASFVPMPGLGLGTGNDIWGWTDPKTGREYAIMGTATTTGFVDVTDPEDPQLVGQLPTSGIPDFVLWRDVKVDGNFAFVVSEVSRHGMQVFDLTRLRDAGPTPTVFSADTVYRGVDPDGRRLSWSHNIAINEQTDTAYVVGSNTCYDAADVEWGGLHMVDISDPLDPKFAGCATVDEPGPGPESNNYVHDAECVVYEGPDADYGGREICFGSNENAVVIYDVTDRANPVVISQTGYPTAQYTHQGWLAADQEWFLFGDELDEGPPSVGNEPSVDRTTTYIMRARDLDAPEAPLAHTHETTSIDHNMYVHGNRVFQSNYTAGLRILEFDEDPPARGSLEEVGYFDVMPGTDVNDFAGTWSNYRFPGSGTVVVTTIENEASGMFVLRPTLDERGGGRGSGNGPPEDKGPPEGAGPAEGNGPPPGRGRFG